MIENLHVDQARRTLALAAAIALAGNLRRPPAAYGPSGR